MMLGLCVLMLAAGIAIGFCLKVDVYMDQPEPRIPPDPAAEAMVVLHPDWTRSRAEFRELRGETELGLGSHAWDVLKVGPLTPDGYHPGPDWCYFPSEKEWRRLRPPSARAK